MCWSDGTSFSSIEDLIEVLTDSELIERARIPYTVPPVHLAGLHDNHDCNDKWIACMEPSVGNGLIDCFLTSYEHHHEKRRKNYERAMTTRARRSDRSSAAT